MTDLPPAIGQLMSLRPNETVIGGWMGAAGIYFLVLTNLRVVFFKSKGLRPRWQLQSERDLRTMPAPILTRSYGAKCALIGGLQFMPQGVGAEAVVAEVSFARSRVVPPDEQTTLVQTQGAQEKQVMERQVIIKEVVKVRCTYCGVLNLESDAKCLSCGAPLGGR